MTDFTPPNHDLITINLHRCAGRPCIKGTRLPTRMVALHKWNVMRTESEAVAYISVRETWGDHISDAQIDAAVAFEADPEAQRQGRLAIRRQRYAEKRAGQLIR